MNYFIVFQTKKYDTQMKGGYLWAPTQNGRGHKRTYWTNMTKVQEGDVIFSVCKSDFVSVNIAKGPAHILNMPVGMVLGEMIKREGWQVDVTYHELKQPLVVDEHIDVILSHCKGLHAPYNNRGEANRGYLYEINLPLGDYLLDEVKKRNAYLGSVLSKA